MDTICEVSFPFSQEIFHKVLDVYIERPNVFCKRIAYVDCKEAKREEHIRIIERHFFSRLPDKDVEIDDIVTIW